MGKTRDGFGFDLKLEGSGGDQSPGTRRVRVPDYPCVWHVPRLECLTISLETFQIDRRRGPSDLSIQIFRVFFFLRVPVMLISSLSSGPT